MTPDQLSAYQAMLSGNQSQQSTGTYPDDLTAQDQINMALYQVNIGNQIDPNAMTPGYFDQSDPNNLQAQMQMQLAELTQQQTGLDVVATIAQFNPLALFNNINDTTP